MEKYRNEYKFPIEYLGRTVTVDLRRIVAIGHPTAKDKYFCVFFENAIWKVGVDQHDRLYRAWMNITQ